MNCTDFEREQIDRVAARETALSDAARDHLATCADCRLRWQTDRSLDQMIVLWRNSLPTVHVGKRVLTALRPDRVHPALPAARASSGLSWALIAAASVMLCVGLTLWRNAGNDRPAVVQRDLDSPLPITNSVVSLWDNVQLQSQQAAVETVRRFEGIPQVAFQEPVPATLPSAVGTNEPITSPRPWLEWGQPLGRQVGQAFQFLGDALPDPNDHSAG